MPTRDWRHYAAPEVAPLCRPRFGAILPTRDTREVLVDFVVEGAHGQLLRLLNRPGFGGGPDL
ncbi:hypothetical protein ANFP_10050 [Acidithiobacillus ferrooxidans]|nr:hypothetical protein ANFP_10050 [Acidithiobacillus ferrooxidans]